MGPRRAIAPFSSIAGVFTSSFIDLLEAYRKEKIPIYKLQNVLFLLTHLSLLSRFMYRNTRKIYKLYNE